MLIAVILPTLLMMLKFHQWTSMISGSHHPAFYQGAQFCHSISDSQLWLPGDSQHAVSPLTSSFLIILTVLWAFPWSTVTR